MDLTFHKDETPESWNTFVRSSPDGSIFCETPFLDSLGCRYDLATVREGNRILAGFPVLFGADGEVRTSQHPFTMYQGVMTAPDSSGRNHSRISQNLKVVTYFLEQLTSHYKSICSAQSWRFEDIRPFQWHNYHEREKGVFQIETGYTGMLRLEGAFEEILKGIRYSRRSEQKKATGQNAKIDLISDPMELDRLHELTFRRQGMVRDPFEAALVPRIATTALRDGFGFMLGAFLGEVLVSAGLFLEDRKSAYYLFGANDPDYRNSGASTLLLLRAIEQCAQRGVPEFDFVGVNSPARGDYKLSFDAALRLYVVARF